MADQTAAASAGWKKCSACKEPIGLGATYYVCSVSTCNQKRTGLQFCSVSCWEVHLPVARHRDAWASERTAPRTPEPATPASAPASGEARKPRRILVGSRPAGAGATTPAPPSGGRAPKREVLIVASRLKEYIRASAGMNVSDKVLESLSDIVREVADRAISNARSDGRKTVLERDVPKR